MSHRPARRHHLRALAAFALAALPAAAACARPAGHAPAPSARALDVRLVTDEADAALAVLAARRAARDPAPAEWERLFAAEGYRRLQEREAAMRRAFTDADFRAFLLSDTLLARAAALEASVRELERADVPAAARRALAYLPSGATIRAKLYVEIKPRTNSFVFGGSDSVPGIFLYVDPAETRAQFENRLAHELHHIGFGTACAAPRDSALPAPLATALLWMGAFGEGFAMLAAAGGPTVHPHAASPPATRARWDRDVANAPADLRRVETFLLDVLDGRVSADSAAQTARTFYGEQGPWYTVGWVMASTIERAFGRERLIAAFCDPREMLATYNAAAAKLGAAGATLPRWSPALAERLRH